MSVKFMVGSTSIIRVKGLKDVDTGAFIEDAVVVAALLTMAGAPVAGADNIPMAKKAGTAGSATVYQGILDESVVLVVGTSYKLRITATSGLGQRVFYLPGTAVEG